MARRFGHKEYGEPRWMWANHEPSIVLVRDFLPHVNFLWVVE